MTHQSSRNFGALLCGVWVSTSRRVSHLCHGKTGSLFSGKTLSLMCGRHLLSSFFAGFLRRLSLIGSESSRRHFRSCFRAVRPPCTSWVSWSGSVSTCGVVGEIETASSHFSDPENLSVVETVRCRCGVEHDNFVDETEFQKRTNPVTGMSAVQSTRSRVFSRSMKSGGRFTDVTARAVAWVY